MASFEDYALPIILELPEAERFDPPKNQEEAESNRIPIGSILEGIDGETVQIKIDGSEQLSGQIVDIISREELNDELREAVEQGLWEYGFDTLAFYKSIHLLKRPPFPGKWGIFIFSHAVQTTAGEIGLYYPGTWTWQETILKALWFLHRHERYHWHIDAWTIAQEAIQWRPLYENYLNYFYRYFYPALTFEEALANRHALISMRREGITSFIHDFMSRQPGMYCKYSDDKKMLRARLAGQILGGPNSILGAPGVKRERYDQEPWIGNRHSWILWDGYCPTYIIPKSNFTNIFPSGIGAPGFKENNDFITRYLDGKPHTTTDHDFYIIDNGEKVKMPNPHSKVDRLKPWEFKGILSKAGMTPTEYRDERARTRMWKNNIPRPLTKAPIN